MDGSIPNRPANFYFDDFEFYKAPKNENIKQIYSLNAVYIKSTNRLLVGWMRDKNENKINHEIRYSFNDIRTNGWESAIPAPKGLISPLGWGGHNGMEYRTRDINMSDNSTVYIAIKPQNSNKFRQIEVPLNSKH
jgi:hypothetical protein